MMNDETQNLQTENQENTEVVEKVVVTKKDGDDPLVESYISYDDFQKLDMRFGIIRHVEAVEGADKLLRCMVEIGEDAATHEFTDEEGKSVAVRQIVSGIKEYVDVEKLVGRQVLYIVNLEPRTIRGVKSYGMLLASRDEGKPLVFVQPEVEVTPGVKLG